MYEELWTCYIVGIPLNKQSRQFISNSPKITHEYAASHYLSSVYDEMGTDVPRGLHTVRVFGRDSWKEVILYIHISRCYHKTGFRYERALVSIKDVEELCDECV